MSLNHKIAVVTNNFLIADEVKLAFKSLYDVYVYKSTLILHQAMEQGLDFRAIITDDELASINGLALLKSLVTLGYGQVPFVVLLNNIDNKDRKLAINEGVKEIFSKPLNITALRVRLSYIIENNDSVHIPNIPSVTYKLPLTKRIFDIIFSGLAMILLSPIFLIIAILVSIESRGPVIYYSLRAGSGYKVFKFFKFRSMFTGAEVFLKDFSDLNQYASSAPAIIAKGGLVKELCKTCALEGIPCKNPLYDDSRIMCEILYNKRREINPDATFTKIKNDPRVTRVGNFIRNKSIDELPQLWNVFIGDMSIVGNRPLPLYEAEKITTDKYALRFIAPAGLTGLWQVEKRGKTDMSEDERLDLDNNYAKTHSFGNDLKLILKTFPVLFQSINT